MKITQFESITKPSGVSRELDWLGFHRHLESHIITFKHKKEIAQFCCVEFNSNYRSMDSIVMIHALVFDVDNEHKLSTKDPITGVSETLKDKSSNPLDFDEAVSILEMAGQSAILYKTPSSKDGWDKFRIIIELNRPLSPLEYQEVVATFLQSSGLSFYSEAIDGCYKNPSQAFFYPAKRLGQTEKPTVLRIEGSPFEVPDATQTADTVNAIVSANNDLMMSDDWWKQYDGDLSTLDVFLLMDSVGLKYGARQPSGAFPCDCPWEPSHKMKAYVITPQSGKRNNRWPIIKCSTDRCSSRGLKDFLGIFGKQTVDSYCSREWKFNKSTIKHATEITKLSPVENVGDDANMHKIHTADLAAMIIKKHTIVRSNDGHVFEYKEPVWKRIDIKIIQKYAQDYDSYYNSTKGRRAEAADFAMNMVYQVDEAIPWNNISRDEMAFMDGVYNIKTGDIRPHKPSDYLDNVIPHNAPRSKYSKSSLWENCLNTWLAGECLEEKKASLQEFFGYILLSHAKYKKALIIYGPTDSGKSLVLQIMAFMVGSANTCSIEIEQMSNPRDLTLIFGKKLNAIAEVGTQTRISDGGFKKLVSCEDMIQIRFNYADPLMYTPTCKHVICGNTLPIVDDHSGATMNRMLIVGFPNRIRKSNQDPFVYVKLCSEIESIIKWAVDGAKRLTDSNGVFTESSESAEMLKVYEESQNIAYDFIDDNYSITGDPDDHTLFEDMYRRFLHYMKKPVDRSALSKILFDMGIRSSRKSVNGIRSRWVFGIKLCKKGVVEYEDSKRPVGYTSSQAFGEI